MTVIDCHIINCGPRESDFALAHSFPNLSCNKMLPANMATGAKVMTEGNCDCNYIQKRFGNIFIIMKALLFDGSRQSQKTFGEIIKTRVKHKSIW